MAIFFQDRLAISARLDSISYAHCITKYLLLVHREAQYINAAAKAKALVKFIPKPNSGESCRPSVKQVTERDEQLELEA